MTETARQAAGVLPSLPYMSQATTLEHGIFGRRPALPPAEGLGGIQGLSRFDIQALRQTTRNHRPRIGRPDTTRSHFHPIECRRRQWQGDQPRLAKISVYRPRLTLRTRVSDRCLPARRPDRNRGQPKHHRTDDPSGPTHRRLDILPKIPTGLNATCHRFSHPSSAIDSVICT